MTPRRRRLDGDEVVFLARELLQEVIPRREDDRWRHRPRSVHDSAGLWFGLVRVIEMGSLRRLRPRDSASGEVCCSGWAKSVFAEEMGGFMTT